MNDPTTTECSLSHVSALLCSIVALPDRHVGLADDPGALLLITRPLDFAVVVELAIEQPWRDGASGAQISTRLFRLRRGLHRARD